MNRTGWDEQELGGILTLNYGWSLPEKKRIPGDVPVFGSNGIVGTHHQALVASPGLIIGRKGSAGNVHYSRKPFCPIDTTFYIAPSNTSLHIEFLYFLLLHIDLKRILGDVGVPGLNREMAYKEKARFPTEADEQRKIADVLGLVQRAIEQQEKLIALTTELKKTLLHKLFAEGLHGEPQKQTEIGPIPKSWEIKSLQDCCIVQTGIAKGRKVEASQALTLPYLRVANVQAGRLDLSEMKAITIRMKERDRYMLRKEDIVLTEGGDFDKLGRGFIWNGEIEDCVHQNHIFAVRVDRSRLIPEFFAHLSQSPYGKAYFLSVAHKTTNLACINTTKLKGFPVLIPTQIEQKEIVQILETVDAKLGQHVRKKQTVSDLFRTLLHQLMTAQIRVHRLNWSNFETIKQGRSHANY